MLSSFSRFARNRRVVGIDRHLVEKRVDGRPELRQRRHGGRKVLARHGLARLRLGGQHHLEERLLLRQPGRLDQLGIGRRIEGAGAVALLLGAQNVRRAAIADEQVRAILAVEEFSKRLDAADDHQQVVLAGKSEDSVDQIVARAFLAEMEL